MQVSTPEIALGGAAFVGSLVLSVAAIGAVLVRIPPDWFVRSPPAFLPGRAAWVRLGGRLGKNLLGLTLVAVGLVMALPGVPGQGLLTILLGVMLLDLPGRRRLARQLVCRPSVRHGIDRVRARFNKPPIVL